MYTPKTPQPMRPKTGKGKFDCFFRRVWVKGFGPWNLTNESHPIKLNELQANSWRWTCWCFGLEFCVWWFLCLEIVVGCSMIVHQAELPPKNPGKNHCHFCLVGSWILSSEVQNYTWTKSQWSFFLVIQVIMSHHESSSPWFKATAWDATPASGEVTSRRVPIGLVTLLEQGQPEKITTGGWNTKMIGEQVVL